MARSCNDCCRRKAIRITYSECVSVTLVNQHASTCAVLHCCLWLVRLFLIFPLRQWPNCYTTALFYNTFIIIIYMFRALYDHHQEVELYWCSIWYRLVHLGTCCAFLVDCLLACPPTDSQLKSTTHTKVHQTIPDAASIQFNLLMMSI